MEHVTWNFHLALVFSLHTVVRLKERRPGRKSILFACSHIYCSERKWEHIDISGRKFKKALKKIETFHSIMSWGQHIQKQEITLKTKCSGSSFQSLILRQNNTFSAMNPRWACSFPCLRRRIWSCKLMEHAVRDEDLTPGEGVLCRLLHNNVEANNSLWTC